MEATDEFSTNKPSFTPRWLEIKLYKTGVINDPLGQTHSFFHFVLFFYILPCAQIMIPTGRPSGSILSFKHDNNQSNRYLTHPDWHWQMQCWSPIFCCHCSQAVEGRSNEIQKAPLLKLLAQFVFLNEGFSWSSMNPKCEEKSSRIPRISPAPSWNWETPVLRFLSHFQPLFATFQVKWSVCKFDSSFFWSCCYKFWFYFLTKKITTK